MKETFKVQLQQEHEKNENEIIELQDSFKITGPHQADMPISVALNQCKKNEEQIEQIENVERRLKVAYRIFNLDMTFSKELQSIKKVYYLLSIIEKNK